MNIHCQTGSERKQTVYSVEHGFDPGILQSFRRDLLLSVLAFQSFQLGVIGHYFPGRDLCKLTKKKRLVLLAVLSMVTILYLTYSDVIALGYRMAVSQGKTFYIYYFAARDELLISRGLDVF